MKSKLIISILLALIISFSSCNNLLVEDSRSEISNKYFNTASGFNSALNAAYSSLRYFYGGNEYGPELVVFGTDLFTNGFDGGQKYLNFYNANLNSRNFVCSFIWDNLYVAINTCNTVIASAPNVKEIDEETKKVRIAEARFLRALYFFILVRQFGPIPIPLKATVSPTTEASRAPIKDVYDVIIDDLDFAMKTLPVIASDYGRATKPAAEHLLAKVYLTRAYTKAKGSNDYEEAAKLAMDVINNYDFILLDDYSKVFEQGNDINSEVIFSVQNSENFLTSGNPDGSCCNGGNTLHTYFLMKYDDLPGMMRDIANGRPWARFKPTKFTLQKLFDRKHDSRFEKSFKRVFYCNNPGAVTSVNGYKITLNQGDTAIFIPDREWTDAEIKKAGYSVFTPSLQTERVYPVLNKYLDPERPSTQEMRGSRDVLIFRLADTYLIAAEALMMSGDKVKAAEYINAVRARAAKKGMTEAETQANIAAMQVTPDQLDIDFILDERGRELLGELMRWFDLVRTGKLIERVKKYNPEAAPNIKSYHILRPIPQDQIDRTTTEFKQNSGY